MHGSFWQYPLPPFGGWQRARTEFMAPKPKVDIIDEEGDVVVRAEVPGFHKEELEVWLSHNTLMIRGTTGGEEKESTGNYCRAEISHESFFRALSLPAAIDESKAAATLQDGILELALPKLKKARRRAISID